MLTPLLPAEPVGAARCRHAGRSSVDRHDAEMGRPDVMSNRIAKAMKFLAGLGTLAVNGAAPAQEEDLARQLANPMAALISVPIQMNYDERFGDLREGHKYYANVQPVIPISFNAEWNIISRTIVPLIDQKDAVPGTSQSGIGDVVQSLFFSSKKPSAGGLIWGVGPVFLPDCERRSPWGRQMGRRPHPRRPQAGWSMDLRCLDEPTGR